MMSEHITVILVETWCLIIIASLFTFYISIQLVFHFFTGKENRILRKRDDLLVEAANEERDMKNKYKSIADKVIFFATKTEKEEK